jgi:hypothetical protein
LSQVVAVEKDEDGAQRVPSVWRQTFAQMVEALRQRNFRLQGLQEVAPVDDETADVIAYQIESYGGTLASLPELTWDTSVCQWQLTHWEVLVDLFTLEDGVADLVLHVMVYEDGSGYLFRPHLVYVP